MQAIIVGLIDPLTIISGLAAGILIRATGRWWTGISFIVVVAIIESYIALADRLYEDLGDHLRLAAILLPGAVIWTVIGLWIAKIARPREKAGPKVKGQFDY